MRRTLAQDRASRGGTDEVSERVDPSAPRLSVVTPVLNGVAFIEACLRNVAEQNCGRVEHIIVDGGSNDWNTGSSRSPRRRTPATSSARQAWNAAIRGDERRHPSEFTCGHRDPQRRRLLRAGTLDRVLELFASFDSPTLLVGNCNLWRDGQEPLVNRPSDLRLESVLLGPHHCPFPFNPAAYFYDKDVHELVGFYDEDDDYTMDVDFLFRALASVQSEYRDELWGHVRVHEKAKTVISKASGLNRGRLRRILNKHRRRLPIARQIALRCRLLVLDARLGVRLLRDPARLRRALRET